MTASSESQASPEGARLAALRARFEPLEIDAYLVTHLPNIRYLSGFSGSAAALLVTAAQAMFVTDFRYREQSRDEVRDARTVVAPGPYREAVAEAAQELKVRRIGFEAPHLTVRQLEEFGESLGDGVELVSCDDEPARLRRTKGPEEIEAIDAAVQLAAGVFDSVLPEFRPGVRERELAATIEYRMRREGATGASFPTIVASGWRAALPHAEASDKEMEQGEFVIVDMGARLDGYCSDMTRTVCLGEPSDEARRIYETVREAQAVCARDARPGMTAREVDRLARSVIDEAGYGEQFGHGTGHGVGIEVHEDPRVSPKAAEDDRLEPGAVFTVEPGIYIPGLCGVRIEDIVVMEEDGPRILTPNPKELLCL